LYSVCAIGGEKTEFGGARGDQREGLRRRGWLSEKHGNERPDIGGVTGG